MAITLIPPTSGSVGGVVYSRNRNGAYMRQRSMPTQPRTSAQVNQRARLSDASAAWRGLTAVQMASWIAFANSFTVANSLGTANHMTGTQAYVKVNSVNALNGDAQVATPPALPTFVPNTTTGMTATAATPLVEVAGSSPAAGTKYMFYASPQVSAGVSFNGQYRYLATFTTATSGNFVLTTAYTTKFGTLVAGKKIFIKVVQSQAGMQDNGTLWAAIVGA